MLLSRSCDEKQFVAVLCKCSLSRDHFSKKKKQQNLEVNVVVTCDHYKKKKK